MQKSTAYFTAAFILGMVALATAIAIVATKSAVLMTVFRWGLIPTLAVQAWLLLRSARQVRLEQRPLPRGARWSMIAMLIAYFVCIGIWIIVLLSPMLPAEGQV